MVLEDIWNLFIISLRSDPSLKNASYKKSAGIPFLYIDRFEDVSITEVEQLIKKRAAGVMKGKQLHCETIYVREESSLLVYRHRFFVPQRKMFCCGNLCADCIRLTP